MTNEIEHIEMLKGLVEETFALTPKTSTDFRELRKRMLQSNPEVVSESTLKRLWGYTRNYSELRETTLNVLCRFVGYPDWHTFVADYCQAESAQTSRRVLGATLRAGDLSIGQQVEIAWSPGRRLLLRHDREGWFTVVEALNSKVKAGDTFHCERFMTGEPLYINNLRHCEKGVADGDSTIPTFVLGKLGGLTRCRKV